MKKTLQITSATTAKELNPLGENPHKYEWVTTDKYQKKVPSIKQKAWQHAEDNRKEYRITEVLSDDGIYPNVFPFLYINMKLEAECNDEDLTAIIL